MVQEGVGTLHLSPSVTGLQGGDEEGWRKEQPSKGKVMIILDLFSFLIFFFLAGRQLCRYAAWLDGLGRQPALTTCRFQVISFHQYPSPIVTISLYFTVI